MVFIAVLFTNLLIIDLLCFYFHFSCAYSACDQCSDELTFDDVLNELQNQTHFVEKELK